MKVLMTKIPLLILCLTLVLVWNWGCPDNSGSTPEQPPETVENDNTPNPDNNRTTPPPAQNPRVKFETTMGDIVVELYPEKAPLTVENFLSYIDQGYYEGTIFHRIMRDEGIQGIIGTMIQGGGITVELTSKSPNDPIPYEADNGLSNTRGALSMVRNNGQPDSATSMFFFNLYDNSLFYDHGHPPIPDAPTADEFGYTVFGTVMQGMDVLDQISKVPLTDKGSLFSMLPIIPVVITKVSVINQKP